MSMKIHTTANNPRAWKALIAAEFSNGAVKLEQPADFKFGTDNKSKEFLAKFPVGKIPALETPEGNIFESNAIARYVARKTSESGSVKLFGANAIENAQVDQWIDFCTGEIDLPAAAWLYPIFGIVPAHKEATEKAKADIKKAFTILHNHLNTRTFLVGERITLADIVLTCSVNRLFSTVMDATFRKPFGNVTRWYLTVVNQPQVHKVIGDVNLCEKMQVAPEAAPAPAAAPAAKKEEKPAASAHGDGEDGGEEKKKKAPNPLDSLPESKLVLDEWKRTYSNTKKIKEEAMPWFWEHYDPAGYCLYECDYKYNNELEMLFKTCNLVSGFIQRLDPLRKYGFGSMNIFGDESGDKKKYEVAGVWLFRGTTIPAEMTECEDAAYYDFKKLDHNNPEDRKKIADFWSWEGNFGGNHLPFLDNGRVFK